MATFTIANIGDALGNAQWSFDGSNFFVGAAGVGITVGAPTGGDVANSVNVSGGYDINGQSIYASPTFTGTVTIPTLAVTTAGTSVTPAVGDNSTKLATTAFVQANMVTGVNKLVNPFMEIDQANEGASVSSVVPAYSVDGWFWVNTNTTATSQRVTDAPTGYSNSIKITTVTGQSVVATTQFYLDGRLEGDDIIDTLAGTANALPLTVTFWFKASISGTYSASIQNGLQTRSYVWNFSYPTPNVWQKFTQTVPGDTGGTWVTSGNALGMLFNVCAAAGSNFQGTAGSWQAANILATSSNTNTIFSTTGATWQLGPCKLEVGSSPTPLLRTSIQSELARCQRYYEKSYDLGTALGAVSANGATEIIIPGVSTTLPAGTTVHFKTTKRVSPTMLYFSPVTGASGKARDNVNSADVTASPDTVGTNSASWFASPSIANTVNLRVQWAADARL